MGTRPINRPESGPARVTPSEAPSARPATSEPSSGMQLGRYELLVPIASGGMAHVWLGQQTGALGFRKLVAVKVIRAELGADPGFRAMFLDEAQLAARIRHANVVEVLDLGEDHGLVYQTMTLVEGAALSTIIVRAQSKLGLRGLPVGVAVRIVVDVLRGLHAAHELRDEQGSMLGVVHRDVSPQNVLVGVDGIAKLSDFGIAKAFGLDARATHTGGLKGKIRYVAPEQLQGVAPTRKSDVFAAGVVLWEALTGKSLFAVATGDDGLRARKNAKVFDPREANKAVPDAIAKVTLRALARDPDDRFGTALEMAEALETAAKECDSSSTHQQVAELVTDCVGRDLERRSEMLRAARAGVALEQVEAPLEPSLPKTLGGAATEVDAAPKSRARSAGIAIGALAIALVAGFGVASLRSSPAALVPSAPNADGAGSATPAGSSTPATPVASEAPRPPSAPIAPLASAPTVVATSSKARTPAARPVRSKAPTPVVATSTASGRKPTFGDPYGDGP